METFPLVVPEGVSLLRDPNSPPVYIWTDGTSPNLHSLIEIDCNHVEAPETTIKGLNVLGGLVGISLVLDGNDPLPNPLGTSANVLIRNVTFGGSSIGLHASSTEYHEVDLAVKGSTIRSFSLDPLSLVHPPVLSLPKIGMAFHATSDSNKAPGRLDVDITNLTTVGNPFPTSKDNFHGDTDYSMTGTVAASRILEFYAIGLMQNNPGEPMDKLVPVVSATLNQCTLGGFANSDPSSGWDFGVYAVSRPNTSSSDLGGYHSMVDVSINGGVIKECELDGIYAHAETDSKTFVSTYEVDIHTNGLGNPSGVAGNGIHTFAFEGYVGIEDQKSTIRANTGRGVLIHNYGARLGIGLWPMGSWVGLGQTSIKNCGSHGVQLAGPKTFLDQSQGGIVGGTWQKNGALSLLYDSQLPIPFDEYGPGYIDRVQIQNNGGDGINIWLADPNGTAEAYAHCSITNSFIWMNGGHGVHLQNSLNDGASTRYLTPILHCTIVKNNATAFNISGIPSTNTWPTFYKTDPAAGAFPMVNPKMRIYNSIFEEISPSDESVNSVTSAHLVPADINTPEDKVGVAGTRGRVPGGAELPGTLSTNVATPFAGYLNPSLPYPNWLFLQDVFDGDFHNATLIGINPDVGEGFTGVDFLGMLRPGYVTGNRDKGGHEAIYE